MKMRGSNSRTENENPYKGLISYREKDREVFYGREKDKKDLSDLIKNEPLTVVFGKSGIGKTSLLNAGLFPLLRENGFLPIRVRLNYSGQTLPLLEQIKKTVKEELNGLKVVLKARDGNNSVGPILKEESLWEYFQRANHFCCSGAKDENLVIPVMVFDQFEEIFTLGKNHHDRDKLIDELYWLIENQFPVPLKEKILKGEKEFSLSTSRPEVRVVISLREDYLPHLTDLKSQIASIDQTMFRVKALNGKQAKEIISMPGGFQEEEMINSILSRFDPAGEVSGENIPDEKLKKMEFEPVFLSLLCHQLYGKKRELKSITEEEQYKILEKFYDTVITDFPNEVEGFIETKLLTERGLRTPFLLEPEHPLKGYIKQLEMGERRILHIFPEGENEYVEVIHDVLAPIIKEKRDRRINEAKRKEYREQIKKRYYKIAIGFFLFIAIIFAYTARYANEQYKNARVNRLTAEALLEFPNDNTKAIRIAEAAYEMGLPDPPSRTCQVLSKIGYSSFENPFYTTILRHKEEVYSAAFSPDGSRILTACEDGITRIWDESGELLIELKGHTGRINSAVFSPNGNLALTSSWDKSVKLFDMESNVLLDLPHQGTIASAVFSQSGTRILTASRDGTAKIFSLKGKLVKTLTDNGILFFAVFSPNEKRILTASWNKGARLLDLDGNLVSEFKHDKALVSAVFSPDGNSILTASEDGTLKLWSLKKEKMLGLKNDKPITAAAFLSNDLRILIAFDDGTFRVCDRAGNFLADLKGHNAAITSSVVFTDGNRILTSSKDGTAKIWELPNILTGLRHTTDVEIEEEPTLTISQDGTVEVRDEGRNYSEHIISPDGAISSAKLSPDGKWILTISVANTNIAKLWDVEKKEFLKDKKIINIDGEISSVIFSPQAKWLLIISRDGSARIWDMKTEQRSKKMIAPEGAISKALFSPNESFLLVISDKGAASVWSVRGELLKKIKSDGKITEAMFSPNNNLICAILDNGTARLWNLDGLPLASIKADSAISKLSFSPDSRMVFATLIDGKARLYTVEGKILSNIDFDAAILSADFLPESKAVLITLADGTMKEWYTPEAIYRWLKTAKIAQLTKEDKDKLGLD